MCAVRVISICQFIGGVNLLAVNWSDLLFDGGVVWLVFDFIGGCNG